MSGDGEVNDEFDEISPHRKAPVCCVCCFVTPSIFWLFNIAMENDPFIDGLPTKMVIFRGYVSHNQMATLDVWSISPIAVLNL